MKAIVIGGGPSGFAAAQSLRQEGWETILIEKRQLGGTCINDGCVPTRVYLQAIKASMELMAQGIRPENKLTGDRLRQVAETKIGALSGGMEYLLQKAKVQILQGEVVSAVSGKVVLSDGTTLSCDEIVIATGAAPVIPGDISWEKLYQSEALLTLTALPTQIDIIGGGVLGVELAVILQYLGVQVSLHEKASRLLPDWDQDIGDAMEIYLKKRGIEIETDAGAGSYKHVVCCCGRKPILPEIDGCDNHIHVIGDARGMYFTADQAAEEGWRTGAALAAARRDGTAAQPVQATSAAVFSQCIFTPLEAATTGSLCGEGLLESYYPIDLTAAGLIFGAQGGFVKVVMEADSHKLRGFHLFTPLASETIQIGQMAVAAEMRAETFLQMVLPHPTEGELLKEAVRRLLCV